MLDEHVELLERPIVEEKLKALAGGQLAALVLGLDAFDTSAKASLGAAAFEFGDDFFHGRKPKRRDLGGYAPSMAEFKERIAGQSAAQQFGFRHGALSARVTR